MITRRLTFLLAAGAIAALPQPAKADDHDAQDQALAREALRRGEIRPLSEILAIVAREIPGDVIKVELERHNGGWQYKIKVLATSGRVREIELDGRTGAVLEIEDE
jgi:uncharacterized membrane protein YkoI